jgi:hypothetical protein
MPVSRSRSRSRRGVALLAALLAMVLITAIISGAFFASSQEYRSGRNTLVEQRAFSVAEYGLNTEIAEWDTGRNLPGGLDVGDVDVVTGYNTGDDTAAVYITRLTPTTFWVTSAGTANVPQPALRATRTVSAVVRLAYPDIATRGAIVTAGNINVTGSSVITGANTSPADWSCDDFTGEDVPAIVAPPSATVNYKEGNILSEPAVVRDDVAADSNTYIVYGSETWNSLVANADLTLPPGTFTGAQPSLDEDDKCARVDTNWGEPLRDAGSVTECYTRFPIIYVNGDFHMAGGRGQGILLVNGDFRINSGAQFYGLVIARDDILKANGDADIYGSVMSRNANLSDDNSVVNGNIDIRYSRCAVENALRGSAILVRVNDRSWAQLY